MRTALNIVGMLLCAGVLYLTTRAVGFPDPVRLIIAGGSGTMMGLFLGDAIVDWRRRG